ncbi:MAG: cell division protein FtsA [Candidatus Bipolaricaulota bacterium]
MSRRVGVVDLGTSSVKVLIGEGEGSGTIKVIGVGKKTLDCTSSNVTDSPEEASGALRDAVERANEMAGTSLSSLYFGIGGESIHLELRDATVSIPDSESPISKKDVSRALDLARANSNYGERIISARPRVFSLDGQDGVSNPVGMYGNRLDVTVELFTATSRIVENVKASASKAGLTVRGIIPITWARGGFFSQASGPHEGRVVVDLGYNSTETSVYRGENLVHWGSLPVGGTQITGDLRVRLNVETENAEKIKRSVGLVEEKAAETNFEYEDFSGESKQAERAEVQKVISSRVEETFDMALEEIEGTEYMEFTEMGIRLVGGTANMPGLVDFLEDRYAFTFRVGLTSPKVLGLQDIIQDPIYANAVGLLLKCFGMFTAKGSPDEKDERSPFASIKQILINLVRNGLHRET